MIVELAVESENAVGAVGDVGTWEPEPAHRVVEGPAETAFALQQSSDAAAGLEMDASVAAAEQAE